MDVDAEFAFGKPSALLGGSSSLLEDSLEAVTTTLIQERSERDAVAGGVGKTQEELLRLLQDEEMMNFGGKHASYSLCDLLDVQNLD